jgi:predicted NACHT family NTPase|tara:strand:+ start:187 stop:453 length:267 start_codon:yes stop_codon:yes gene_type:complete
MSQNYYLPRTLFIEEQQVSETGLLKASNYIVALAEPGAGKSELMKSLAQQLGSRVVTANSFSHDEAASEGTPLIIDAFDELAKVDATC